MDDDHDEHDHDEDGEAHAGAFPGRLMVMDADNHAVQVFDLANQSEWWGPSQYHAQHGRMASRHVAADHVGSYCRYGFVMNRTGHYSPNNDPACANQILIIDSGGHGVKVTMGTWTRYGRHRAFCPTGWVTAAENPEKPACRYRPIHWSSHHGFTAIFYDGSILRNDDGLIVDSVNGVAVCLR